MIFVALDEAARKGELLLADGGLLRFHRRRDGVVTIHEIVVLPKSRRRGIGRRLVDEVRGLHPAAVLRAVCPRGYESNGFWARLGFRVAAETEKANVWEWYPNSSTAPTGTPSSPASP